MTEKYISKTIGIIPAHTHSRRFSQKLLKKIGTQSLLEITYKNAMQCKSLDALYVATYQKEIVDLVHSFGGQVYCTDKRPKTGTECISYVVHENPHLQASDFILNIQGDEPLIPLTTLDKLVDSLKLHPAINVATPIAPMNEEHVNDPSRVKCVINLNGEALYFSRSKIPSKGTLFYQHLGIYAFRTKFLSQLQTLTETPLQISEDLEQLKILEHGFSIQCVIEQQPTLGIDTRQDFQTLRKILCLKTKKHDASLSQVASALL